MTKLLLIFVFLLMLLLEGPKLLVKKQFWDLTVFLGLWSLALFIALLQAWHVKIPSPVAPVIELLRPLVSK